MSQDLIIVGAGGWGIDAYDFITSINNKYLAMGKEEPYRILGFIDDSLNALEKWKGIHSPLLGTIEEWWPKGSEHYVLGVATPRVRERLVTKLKARGAVFETIISPETWIPESAEIGEGCYLDCIGIGQNVKIGNFVALPGKTAVGQGVEIGDYSAAGAYVNIASGVIGKRVFIGSHAVIINDAVVGDDAYIAACSLVLRKVNEGTKVFGVPATRMKL